MPRSPAEPCVDTAGSLDVLGHRGRDVHAAAGLDEAARIVGIVGADSDRRVSLFTSASIAAAA